MTKSEAMQAQRNKVFSRYQIAAQKVFNENTKVVLKVHTTARLQQLEQSFTLIIQSFETYTVALDEQERFAKNTLTGNVTKVGATSTQQLDDIVDLPWMLLLVGEI